MMLLQRTILGFTETRLVARMASGGCLVLTVLLFLAGYCRTDAAVVPATDCSLDAVQTAINLATPGDTVQVPAGTATWTSNLVVGVNIHLIGAGIDQTIITNGVITYSTNWSGITTNIGNLIQFNTTSSDPIELAGFSFNAPYPTNAIGVNNTVTFLTYCPSIRVHNCRWQDLNQCGLEFDRASYGVVDHCWFQNYNNNYALMGITAHNGHNPVWTDSCSSGYGDWQWSTNDPVIYGSTNEWVYVENCVFDSQGTADKLITDGRDGSKMCLRFNTITNGGFQTHAQASRDRAFRAFEIYGNTNVNNGSLMFYSNPFYITSGSGNIFSNTFTGWTTGIGGWHQYRATDNPGFWGAGNGLSPWDLNSNGIIASGTHTGTNNSYFLEDTNATWTAGQFANSTFEIIDTSRSETNTGTYTLIVTNTATRIYGLIADAFVYINWTHGDTYQVRQVLRSLDQTGAGNGDLLQGESATNTVLGGAAWPRQAMDPVYVWANTEDGAPNMATLNYSFSDNGNGISASCNAIRLGIDVLNTNRPAYTPLVYPHPLIGVVGPQVTNPPAIFSQPQSQTVLEGGSVSFSAPAIGANLAYSWQLNNVPITGATNSTFILSSADITDVGSYTVVVSNLYGSVTSSPAVLIVTTPTPQLSPPSGLSVFKH